MYIDLRQKVAQRISSRALHFVTRVARFCKTLSLQIVVSKKNKIAFLSAIVIGLQLKYDEVLILLFTGWTLVSKIKVFN